MSRFRTPLLILGVLGALAVAAAVFFVIRAGRGTPIQLPVAIEDIPPGTPLDPTLFKLEEVRGLTQETLDAYITTEEFPDYVGRPTLETIHANSPALKAQVDPERQSRLTLTLSDPAHLVYPLPVTADQVGDYVVAGDYVDVIFTLGRVAMQEMVHVEEWEYDGPAPDSLYCRGTVTETQPLICPGDLVSHTTVLNLPVSKVVLPDAPVMRVEREEVRSASASYGMGGEETQTQVTEGEILRLYLELDREQAEVLSFALHNGALNLPARAEPAGGESEGFTWQDFEDLFYQGRPEEELRGELGK
jgi:Flp pilus assembly protein CpaB